MTEPASKHVLRPRSAAPRGLILVLLGLAVCVALVAWQGVATITEMLAVAGVSLLWLAPVYLVPLSMAAAAWRLLLPEALTPAFPCVLHACWIGTAVNWLLPVAQIGGGAVKARLLVARAAPPAPAIASVVADKTIQATTIPLFAVIGTGAYAVGRPPDVVLGAVLTIAPVLAVLVLAFVLVQRAGMFGLGVRLLRRTGAAAAGRVAGAGAAEIDAALRQTYARRARLGRAVAWRMAFRLVLVGELWLITALLGRSVTLVDALVLESLGGLVTAAGFAVPGALGVQEGGFMLLAASLGLGPELGLAVSLSKRVRELTVGLLALVAWQWLETRPLLWKYGKYSPRPEDPL